MANGKVLVFAEADGPPSAARPSNCSPRLAISATPWRPSSSPPTPPPRRSARRVRRGVVHAADPRGRLAGVVGAAALESAVASSTPAVVLCAQSYRWPRRDLPPLRPQSTDRAHQRRRRPGRRRRRGGPERDVRREHAGRHEAHRTTAVADRGPAKSYAARAGVARRPPRWRRARRPRPRPRRRGHRPRQARRGARGSPSSRRRRWSCRAAGATAAPRTTVRWSTTSPSC